MTLMGRDSSRGHTHITNLEPATGERPHPGDTPTTNNSKESLGAHNSQGRITGQQQRAYRAGTASDKHHGDHHTHDLYKHIHGKWEQVQWIREHGGGDTTENNIQT